MDGMTDMDATLRFTAMRWGLNRSVCASSRVGVLRWLFWRHRGDSSADFVLLAVPAKDAVRLPA
jgi:hypothetical protein